MELSRREWEVLQEAARFEKYYWAQATSFKLIAKGLMEEVPGSIQAFRLTQAGRDLVKKEGDDATSNQF